MHLHEELHKLEIPFSMHNVLVLRFMPSNKSLNPFTFMSYNITFIFQFLHMKLQRTYSQM